MKRDFVIRKEVLAGIKLLKILQMVKDDDSKGQRRLGKINDKLRKVLKKYYDEETVLIANELLVKQLGIPNLSFEARKQEFVCNKQEIFQCFRKKMEMQQERCKFLLVLDSIAWKQKEIVDILLEVKNYYEDIYIVVGKSIVDVGQLVEFLFDECGLIVHIITDEIAKNVSVETVLFLVEEWDDEIKEYPFDVGYVVTEWENNLKRRKRHLQRIEKGSRALYAGFVYESEKKRIPYEIAVILMNNLKKGKQRTNSKDLIISIVAIYSVE